MSRKPKPIRSRKDVEKCIQRFSLAWQEPISNEELKPSANDLLAAVEWTLARISTLEHGLRKASERLGWLAEYHLQGNFAPPVARELSHEMWNLQAGSTQTQGKSEKP